jgi:lipopolysaccharide/colanic/teichoic acid biosynthesis glycosyltransferase
MSVSAMEGARARLLVAREVAAGAAAPPAGRDSTAPADEAPAAAATPRVTHAPALPPEVVVDPRRRRLYFAAKRAVDLVVASAALIVTTPLLALVALAIKLDSPGPVLFTHERIGSRRRVRAGRTTWELGTFRVWKFRTMWCDVDDSLHESHIRAFVEGRLAEHEEEGTKARFKLHDDPRITRVGGLLRRLSLDELPQLVNVVAGTMTLVGPRPVPPYEAVLYPSSDRFAAQPGITGLWQVRGRCDLPIEQMWDLDRIYVSGQSLWLDLKILALTIPAVVGGRGAG